MQTRQPRPLPRAFTLIELLVVVAIVALLIGILLPTLGLAREKGRQAVCLSNAKQLVLAATLYAQDYGVIWPGIERNRYQCRPNGLSGWAFTPPPRKPGLLFDYVGRVDAVTECPTKRRQSRWGEDGDHNMFDNAYLNFDYTMVTRMEGATMDIQTHAAFLREPATYPVHTDPPESLGHNPEGQNALVNLSGLPLFVDESNFCYNDVYRDGAWSNWDQITEVHGGGGTVGYLQGHAGVLDFPRGDSEMVDEQPDLSADDFYVLGQSGWIRMEKYGGGVSLNHWGWINAPN